MAVTKIHAITATVDKAVAYICNPDKTDGSIYISSYACAPETAAIDFKYTLDHCRENSPNKAYHLIQAFAPGEVSFDEAHQIGKELADKVLEGKFSYVVTTHIDKGHVHNHMRRYVFWKPKHPDMLFHVQLYCFCRKWFLPYCAGEQPPHRSAIPVPVFRKDLQVAVTEYGISVLPVL